MASELVLELQVMHFSLSTLSLPPPPQPPKQERKNLV